MSADLKLRRLRAKLIAELALLHAALGALAYLAIVTGMAHHPNFLR